MLEYAGRIEDGLPPIDVTAYAVLAGADRPGVVYVPTLTVAHTTDAGAEADPNMLLTRLGELGWAPMFQTADSTSACPGWDSVLDGEQFTVRQPDGAHWYAGTLPFSPAWYAAVRATRHLDHYTGDHNALDPILKDVAEGRALTIRTTVR